MFFTNINFKTWLIIAFSILAALFLTYLPLPNWANFFRPEWFVLVLLFWVLIMPYRVSVGTAWILGLLLDVADGSILGIHALAFVIVAYLVVRFRTRIIRYSLAWQSAVIGLIVLIYQVVIYWISGATNATPTTLLYWLPTFTSALFWPWVYMLLRDLHQKFLTD
jgi:rod shape-determining protein MreD